MSKIKVFNDPIYGLVSYPFEILYDLIDHPYFQRLRRIQQLGMSSIVYPGATHTRFHHALGALHLCDRLLSNLKKKGVRISEEEEEATLIAILLHDIGHGPYSHALESILIPSRHEDLTIRIMKRLNKEFDGRLSLAIKIFTDQYDRPFFFKMISGQVDVDRMDYLNRDSFYTGVAEGIIGYDRIIKMMNVVEEQLVIEEKGILSIEKFLLSRYFMYHQVYLHKAALCADHMLKLFFNEFKRKEFKDKDATSPIQILLKNPSTITEKEQLDLFLKLDDSDIILLIKTHQQCSNQILNILSNGLINRRLFKVKTSSKPFSKTERKDIIKGAAIKSGLNVKFFSKMVNFGKERSSLYEEKDEIRILRKRKNKVVTFGEISRLNVYQGMQEVHFVTYPKARV